MFESAESSSNQNLFTNNQTTTSSQLEGHGVTVTDLVVTGHDNNFMIMESKENVADPNNNVNIIDNSNGPNNHKTLHFRRKSYSVDFKKRAIELRDSGLRIQSIATLLDTAKSNVEKWCSAKVSLPFIHIVEFVINQLHI